MKKFDNKELIKDAISQILEQLEKVCLQYVDEANDEQLINDPIRIVALALNEMNLAIDAQVQQIVNELGSVENIEQFLEMELENFLDEQMMKKVKKEDLN